MILLMCVRWFDVYLYKSFYTPLIAFFYNNVLTNDKYALMMYEKYNWEMKRKLKRVNKFDTFENDFSFFYLHSWMLSFINLVGKFREMLYIYIFYALICSEEEENGIYAASDMQIWNKHTKQNAYINLKREICLNEYI